MTRSVLLAWISVITVAAVLLSCVGCVIPLQLLVYLGGGWAIFLSRVAGELTIDWPALGFFALALGLFIVAAHAMLRWFSGAAQRERGSAEVEGRGVGTWRLKWTLAATAMILLAFVAGVSVVGVTHQIVWMVTDDRPMLSSGWEAASRSSSANNLKQLGLGALNYHDRHRHLPVGAFDDRLAVQLHGWQTALLPFVDQGPLYDTIDPTVPWDHANNQAAMRTRIAAFEYSLRVRDRRYDQPSGGFGPSHYAANSVLMSDRPRGDILRGSSQTIFAGEIVEEIPPWGRPANWRDPRRGINQSSSGFGSPWRTAGAQFVLADGSVRFLSDDVDPRVLAALATPDGGEQVDFD